MKPRTKLQREVLEMRKELPELSDAQKSWAMKNCFEGIGYYWKTEKKIWCQICGHFDYVDLPELYVSLEGNHVCPECGRELKLKSWQYEKQNAERGNVYESALYSLITTHKKWTIIRTFMVQRNNVRGRATSFQFWEVYQIWLFDDGREVILSKAYTRSAYHFSWQFYSEWGINRHNDHCTGYFQMSDVYDTQGNWFYPRQKVSAILKRNGWHAEIMKRCKVDATQLMKLLLTEPLAEELVKVRQYNVLEYWMNAGGPRKDRSQWLHAVRICIRNHYYIEDASMFFDYLDLLEHFHKDTHNAKYVCPKDLKKEHDRLMRKKMRIDEEKQLKARIKMCDKFEDQYKIGRERFFGICFGNEKITITVICSVKEMAEEGTRMHHCVFSNAYYDMKRHPDSLILSAKDKDGNRLETIEVNLKSWKIVQSRGLQNNPTSAHGEIMELMKKNMYRLKQVA